MAIFAGEGVRARWARPRGNDDSAETRLRSGSESGLVNSNNVKGLSSLENRVPCPSAPVQLKQRPARNIRFLMGLGMKKRVQATRFFAAVLALCSVHGAAFAQAVHLDALREWLRNTEEAAKYVERGDYAKAEQRLTLAIKEVRPYFPETQRMMAQLLRTGSRALSSEAVRRSRAVGSMGPLGPRIRQEGQARRRISVCLHARFDPVGAEKS